MSPLESVGVYGKQALSAPNPLQIHAKKPRKEKGEPCRAFCVLNLLSYVRPLSF